MATATQKHPDLAAAFGRVVADTHIERRRDRKLLAHMLAEVAGSDGHLSPNQRRFFAVFGERSEDDLDQWVTRPMLTKRQLHRVRPELREPFVCFALAMAYADGRYSIVERALIERYFDAMDVPLERLVEFQAMACAWFLEEELEHLYAYGHPDAVEYREFMEGAQALGIEEEELKGFEFAFLERHGWWDRLGAMPRS